MDKKASIPPACTTKWVNFESPDAMFVTAHAVSSVNLGVGSDESERAMSCELDLERRSS